MLKDILKLSNGKVLDCHKIVVGVFYIEILNDNDQEVYFERSEGYWGKSEYNEKGKEVYYEDSDGYWRKSKYDEKGKEVYYENSDGCIEDNRPKTQELTIEEIQSKLGLKLKLSRVNSYVKRYSKTVKR